jgi:transcriptional regulator with XRE-family HTH domain
MSTTRRQPIGHLRAAIRAEMARHGRTQREMADLLGLTQPTVSGRMSGRTDFTITELRAVARWLGVSVSALIGEDAA